MDGFTHSKMPGEKDYWFWRCWPPEFNRSLVVFERDHISSGAIAADHHGADGFRRHSAKQVRDNYSSVSCHVVWGARTGTSPSRTGGNPSSRGSASTVFYSSKQRENDGSSSRCFRYCFGICVVRSSSGGHRCRSVCAFPDGVDIDPVDVSIEKVPGVPLDVGKDVVLALESLDGLVLG